MIIQIRGTSGSGKTWVMNQFMYWYQWDSRLVAGRKKPLFYETEIQGKAVAVLGHYESACGGCDNIGSAAAVYDLIQKIQQEFDVIVCEGLLLSEDVKWTCQMQDVKVLFLSTGIETCISQVKSRRLEAGNAKPLNEFNTRNRVEVIERARTRLVEAGVHCVRSSATQAVNIIHRWIKDAK